MARSGLIRHSRPLAGEAGDSRTRQLHLAHLDPWPLPQVWMVKESLRKPRWTSSLNRLDPRVSRATACPLHRLLPNKPLRSLGLSLDLSLASSRLLCNNTQQPPPLRPRKPCPLELALSAPPFSHLAFPSAITNLLLRLSNNNSNSGHNFLRRPGAPRYPSFASNDRLRPHSPSNQPVRKR